MISNNLNIYLSSSIVIIPLLLITGPFLPDLILTLSGLIFIFLLLIYKKFEIFNNLFFKLFAIFLIIININSFISGIEKSIISSLGYVRFLFFTFLVVYLLDNSKIDLKLYVFYLLMFCYFYLFFEFMSQLLFSQTLTGVRVFNNTRFFLSSFYDEQIYSSYVVRFLPILIGFYYVSKKNLSKFFKLFFYVVIFFIVLSILYNGERTAIGYLCVVLSLMILFVKESPKKKILIISSFLVLMSIVILNVSEENLGRKLHGIKQFKSTVIDLDENSKTSEIKFISDKYNSLYRTSYNIFRDNIIFGVGIKNFRVFCKDEKYAFDNRSCSTSPHNLFLQIMAELGIVGVTYYILIFGSVIYFFYKNLKNKKIKKNRKNFLTCLFISIIINLFPFLPSGNFFNNWHSIIYFFPVGFIISELYKARLVTVSGYKK